MCPRTYCSFSGIYDCAILILYEDGLHGCHWQNIFAGVQILVASSHEGNGNIFRCGIIACQGADTAWLPDVRFGCRSQVGGSYRLYQVCKLYILLSLQACAGTGMLFIRLIRTCHLQL
jgi:hypothetical protein